MKILRLQSQNVMRLTAVDITPEGNLVIVGGKNAAGKSSVLNSIAMALGGKDMCPIEPIRAGESEGRITVTLDDLTVTRRFTRDKIHYEGCESIPTAFNDTRPCNCLSKEFGDTKSTLVVKSKDGATYPSPQAMLDKLLGRLTFDPLAFARMGETADGAKRQDATLRKLVGIDVTPLENRRAQAVLVRSAAKKTLAAKEAQLAAMPEHKDAPPAEIPMDAISQEMMKAEEYRKLAEDAERAVDRVKADIADGEGKCKANQFQIDELMKQVTHLQHELTDWMAILEDKHRDLDAKTITAQSARAVVPDPTAIRQRLTDAEATNAKVRANAKRADALQEVVALTDQVAEHDAGVKSMDEAKRRMLDHAKFPVEGLGVSDDGVTFGGLPFSQASSSEQMRVSVAIGIALNPSLKVLLVRNGNMLDDDAMQALAEQAAEAGAQVWCEYVTSNADGVQVMIEDGHVAEKA